MEKQTLTQCNANHDKNYQVSLKPMSFGTFNHTQHDCERNGGIWFGCQGKTDAKLTGCWGVATRKKSKPLLR